MGWAPCRDRHGPPVRSATRDLGRVMKPRYTGACASTMAFVGDCDGARVPRSPAGWGSRRRSVDEVPRSCSGNQQSRALGGPLHEGVKPMRALVYRGRRQFMLEEAPQPKPGPGEVLLRPAYAAVCFSDKHRYEGLSYGKDWRHGLI